MESRGSVFRSLITYTFQVESKIDTPNKHIFTAYSLMEAFVALYMNVTKSRKP